MYYRLWTIAVMACLCFAGCAGNTSLQPDAGQPERAVSADSKLDAGIGIDLASEPQVVIDDSPSEPASHPPDIRASDAFVSDLGTVADAYTPDASHISDLRTPEPTTDNSPPEKPGTPAVAPVYTKEKYKVKLIKDVIYGKAIVRSSWTAKQTRTVDMKLDVFQPIGANHKYKPVLVVIHGGGFKGGSKENTSLVAIAREFTARGWVCFSISYRLDRDHGLVPGWWPQQALRLYPAGRDAKAAIRWIRANASKYGIHPGYISAMGGSAGAGIAIALGLTFENDFKTELTNQQDPTLKQTNLKYSSNVQIVVNNWGGTWLQDVLKLHDNKSRYRGSNPPMITFHGAKDKTVSVNYAYQLRDAYKKTGVPYELHIDPQAGHSAWRSRFGGKTISQLSYIFIVKQLKLKQLP